MVNNTKVVIITGPTASGKTEFAEQLAVTLGGEIINADVGQFYSPLTVGTAKPDWRNKPFKSYLFDILDLPCDMSVVEYRQLVLSCVNDIVARGKVPIIVGGSLFYLKGLVFPPRSRVNTSQKSDLLDFSKDTKSLWNMLQSIDPERARMLHPNDRYRIERALKIWHETGYKPSQLIPLYDPPFQALWVVLQPSREILNQRINERTRKMLAIGGWIDETRALLDTSWERFVRQKGLIGYAELIAWLRGQLPAMTIISVGEFISQRTRQYAKRQLIFLKKLISELEQHRLSKCYRQDIYIIPKASPDNIIDIVNRFND